MRQAFATLVVRHRIAVLVLLSGLTACLAVPLLQLRIGYSVTSFLQSEEPLLKEAAAHYGEFAVPDNLLLFCFPEADPYGIDAQERLDDLDRALRGLPGVERVLTLASAPGFARGHGEWLAKRVRASNTWRHLLVSKQEDALGGVVVLNRDEGAPRQRRQLFERLLALPEVQAVDLKLAGIPYHRNAVIGMIRHDQLWFIPICVVITSLLLLWMIPDVRMALLCLAVVPFTLVATLGTMSLCGIELTLLTSALPVLLMCMAVAGGVHLVGRFLEERHRGRDPIEAAVHTTARLLLPCFLTSLTTAIGFLTLSFTSIPDLRHLGLFAALGVGYAYVFTVSVMPAALSLVKGRPRPLRVDLAGGLAGLAARFAAVRPARVLLPSVVLLAAGLYGAAHVDRNNHMKGDLWDDSQVAQELAFYEQRFLSMAPSEVLVTAPSGFGSAQARSSLEQLVGWLESLPAVDRSISIADLFRDELPMWLVRGMASIGGLLSKDGKTARVLVFQEDMGNRYLAQFRDDVRAKSDALAHVEARVVGVQVVATTLVDRLTGVLSRSFAGSLLVILGLIWWHFRSLRLGLIAIVPNLFPLLLNLGVMGAVGMELRPLTVISFCVAFGLAVDDTVHLLARYREERRAGAGADAALRTMLVTAGRPVVVTTVLLLVGFVVVLSSSFKGTFQFGSLVSLALVGSLLGALFLLPALMRVTSRWERGYDAAT